MPDFDEMRLLRDADPAEAAAPSASDPARRALSERIMMDDVTQVRSSRAKPLVAAAVAAAVIATGSVVLATRDSGPVVKPPVTPGGQAMCVEIYDLTTLSRREVAFDGTVASVNGDAVTFSVNEWFKGGAAKQITLQGASTFGGTSGAITSAGDGVTLSPGVRVLVAGDDGFAWGCGFTQAYSKRVADEWRVTLS